MTPHRSEELSGKLSEDEIAKEVGFSKETMERAEVIHNSDLPDKKKHGCGAVRKCIAGYRHS